MGPEWLEKLLRLKIDNESLMKIAAADYGNEKQGNFKALKKILDGDFTTSGQWVPEEVLSLTQWNSPAGSRKYGMDLPAPVSEYWQALFSCYVLLKSNTLPSIDLQLLEPDSTLVQFLEKALILGREPAEAALAFMVWMEKIQGPDQGPVITPIGIEILKTALGYKTKGMDEAIEEFLKEDPEAKDWLEELLQKKNWDKLLQIPESADRF